MTTLEVQKILARLGYKPGPIDGIWGRRTAAAVRSFQIASGLDPDGVVGPLTTAALVAATDLDVSDEPMTVWYEEAARQYGTKEVPGPASNRTIIDWADDRGIAYRSDDIPWCGLFVAHCIGSTLDLEPLPSSPLTARRWSSFGIPIEPTMGAVLVFWRGSRSGWKGHVGFYSGEDDGAYRVLGGNQSDMVNFAWIAKDRLIGARWPSTVPPPIEPDVFRVARNSHALSRNEA